METVLFSDGAAIRQKGGDGRCCSSAKPADAAGARQRKTQLVCLRQNQQAESAGRPEPLRRSGGDRWWAAELYRLKGDVLSRSNAPAEIVEAHFQQAIALARRQNAKSLELRAVTSLAQLWHQQGQTAAACRQLAEIYGWFSEGATTADHRAAQTLLAELMAV